MVTRIDPFQEFENFAGRFLPSFVTESTRQIAMDLFKDNEKYVVSADLPGVSPDSIDIDVDGRTLTISAERKRIDEHEDAQWITRERQSGKYTRQLSLGQDIDIDNISAHYNDGVLNVILPISAKAQSRKVSVNRVEDVSVDSAE